MVVDSSENSGMLISYFVMKSVLMLINMTGVTKRIEAKSKNTQRMTVLVMLTTDSFVKSSQLISD